MGPTDFILHCVIQKSLGRKVFEDSILVSAGRQHLQDVMLSRARTLNQGHARDPSSAPWLRANVLGGILL